MVKVKGPLAGNGAPCPKNQQEAKKGFKARDENGSCITGFVF